jgi:hypothetical protein
MLQHLPDDTFADRNIPREADYIFVGPTTHGVTSQWNVRLWNKELRLMNASTNPE